MLPNLPIYLPILFLLIVVLTLFLGYNYVSRARSQATSGRFKTILIMQVLWLAIQGTLASLNFYSDNLRQFPPRLFIFGLLPPLLLITLVLVTRAGRNFIDELPVKSLILLHVVRIPVEIGLFLLYLYGVVPKLMTFEGGNLDILSGISAVFVFYFAFTRRGTNYMLILIWNIFCLSLLLNIVIRALLSAPFPLQKFAFDQPNVAILHFPFVLLPTFIVPMVLFSHLAIFKKIFSKKR